MQEIKVSIIIPTFNRAYVLNRAIESVLTQSYLNYELIIVDDGSTDHTKEVVLSYEVKSKKIYYYQQENKGVSAARNFGVSKSKGEWIAFLDSDDAWDKDKLLKQVNYLIEHPNNILIHTNEIWIRNGVRVNQMNKHKKGGGNQFIPSLKLCLISPSSVMIKKSIFNEQGGFREDYPVCEDYDLWLKLTSLYQIAYLDEGLIYKYGGHEDQLSRASCMDYYRIKSLEWINNNRDLEETANFELVKILKKKAQILIKGYIKHNNLSNLAEIKKILEKYN